MLNKGDLELVRDDFVKAYFQGWSSIVFSISGEYAYNFINEGILVYKRKQYIIPDTEAWEKLKTYFPELEEELAPAKKFQDDLKIFEKVMKIKVLDEILKLYPKIKDITTTISKYKKLYVKYNKTHISKDGCELRLEIRSYNHERNLDMLKCVQDIHEIVEKFQPEVDEWFKENEVEIPFIARWYVDLGE